MLAILLSPSAFHVKSQEKRRRHRNLAVVMLVASAATLMISSTPSSNKGSIKYLRFSRYLLATEPSANSTTAGTDIWVVNQPKSGTGFLVSTALGATPSQGDKCTATKEGHIWTYDCPKQSRVFRTHDAPEAGKFRTDEAGRAALVGKNEEGKKEERGCFAVSGVRDPHLSIPSRFFESNKNRLCDGHLAEKEVISEYVEWLSSSDEPRLQMHTTSELVKAFGIQDFSHALDGMYQSGYALFEGPSDTTSPWNGCKLLLVQLDFEENNDNISEGLSTLLNDDVKPAEYPSRTDLCPDAAGIYKALQEFELTDDLLRILAKDNPELRQGLNYYRRRSSEDLIVKSE